MANERSIARGRGALALFSVQPGMRPVPQVEQAPVSAAGSSSGEMPSTGWLRPGPAGAVPPPLVIVGAIPISIKIPAADVDSSVEQQTIDNGVMHDPSGPYVVSWYKTTGKLGEANNIVMAGHLDWYGVPQAVFYHVGDLKKGDPITVAGANHETYDFSVDWVKAFTVADLDQKTLDSIVGESQTEELTLITCGGEWDAAKQEYVQRTVIRASKA